MTRLTILASITAVAFLATINVADTRAADAKAQGNGPQTSEIARTQVTFRFTSARQVSLKSNTLVKAESATAATHNDTLPEVVDSTMAPSNAWNLRPMGKDFADMLNEW